MAFKLLIAPLRDLLLSNLQPCPSQQWHWRNRHRLDGIFQVVEKLNQAKEPVGRVEEVVVPSQRDSAGAVDLRTVSQIAGRLIQEKGEEGVPVRGVRFCRVYDIARRG